MRLDVSWRDALSKKKLWICQKKGAWKGWYKKVRGWVKAVFYKEKDIHMMLAILRRREKWMKNIFYLSCFSIPPSPYYTFQLSHHWITYFVIVRVYFIFFVSFRMLIWTMFWPFTYLFSFCHVFLPEKIYKIDWSNWR